MEGANDVINWCNANAGFVEALLTLAIIGATLRYVVLTDRLLRENQELRRQATRPTLAIRASIHEAHINIINLVIENIGGGPAHRIALKASHPFRGKGERPLNEVGPFKKGLRYLGPHQGLELFLANAIGNLDELKQAPIEIATSYFDEAGQSYKNTFVIDYSELENIERVGEPPLFTIAERVTKLQEGFERLTNGMAKLPVIAYSLADLDAERGTQNLWRRIVRLTQEERNEVGVLVETKLALKASAEKGAP